MIGSTAREIAESFRRGPRRGDALLELNAHGVIGASHLAAAIGVSEARLVAMMHGRLPGYRHDTALVPLKLARQLAVRRGRTYEITDLGREVAKILAEERRRELHARHARQDAMRRRRRSAGM